MGIVSICTTMEVSDVCVCEVGGSRDTMNEPWCVFISCYDSSFLIMGY